MLTLRRNTLFINLISLIFASSCNYHYYYVIDVKGNKLRIKKYNSSELQHKVDEKLIVKRYYKPETYIVDSTCISKTDSSMDCDSIKVLVLPDSREFSNIFITGIIPCRLLSKMYGKPLKLKAIDAITRKEIIDTSPKSLFVRNVHHLTFVKTKPTSRILSFKITPYTYYIELTNDNAGSKTSILDFIKDSRLTWFYQSNVVEI